MVVMVEGGLGGGAGRGVTTCLYGGGGAGRRVTTCLYGEFT